MADGQVISASDLAAELANTAGIPADLAGRIATEVNASNPEGSRPIPAGRQAQVIVQPDNTNPERVSIIEGYTDDSGNFVPTNVNVVDVNPAASSFDNSQRPGALPPTIEVFDGVASGPGVEATLRSASLSPDAPTPDTVTPPAPVPPVPEGLTVNYDATTITSVDGNTVTMTSTAQTNDGRTITIETVGELQGGVIVPQSATVTQQRGDNSYSETIVGSDAIQAQVGVSPVPIDGAVTPGTVVGAFPPSTDYLTRTNSEIPSDTITVTIPPPTPASTELGGQLVEAGMSPRAAESAAEWVRGRDREETPAQTAERGDRPLVRIAQQSADGTKVNVITGYVNGDNFVPTAVDTVDSANTDSPSLRATRRGNLPDSIPITSMSDEGKPQIDPATLTNVANNASLDEPRPRTPAAPAPAAPQPRTLADSVGDYADMGWTVRPTAQQTGVATTQRNRIAAAVTAVDPSATSFIVAQNNGRDVVIAGHVEGTGTNTRFVAHQTYNVAPNNTSLVPAPEPMARAGQRFAMTADAHPIADLAHPQAATQVARAPAGPQRPPAGHAPGAHPPGGNNHNYQGRAGLQRAANDINNALAHDDGPAAAAALREFNRQNANRLPRRTVQINEQAAQNFETMQPGSGEASALANANGPGIRGATNSVNEAAGVAATAMAAHRHPSRLGGAHHAFNHGAGGHAPGGHANHAPGGHAPGGQPPGHRPNAAANHFAAAAGVQHGTPSGPARAGAVGGVGTTADGTAVTVSVQNGRLTARDTNNQALAAGTVVTATVDDGRGHTTQARYEVLQNGALAMQAPQAPQGAPVAPPRNNGGVAV